jgi:hypothetical protein
MYSADIDGSMSSDLLPLAMQLVGELNRYESAGGTDPVGRVVRFSPYWGFVDEHASSFPFEGVVGSRSVIVLRTEEDAAVVIREPTSTWRLGHAGDLSGRDAAAVEDQLRSIAIVVAPFFALARGSVLCDEQKKVIGGVVRTTEANGSSSRWEVRDLRGRSEFYITSSRRYRRWAVEAAAMTLAVLRPRPWDFTVWSNEGVVLGRIVGARTRAKQVGAVAEGTGNVLLRRGVDEWEVDLDGRLAGFVSYLLPRTVRVASNVMWPERALVLASMIAVETVIGPWKTPKNPYAAGNPVPPS